MINFPVKGDVIVLNAEPHSGKEFGGHNESSGNVRRHMIVMSSDAYNRATGMVLAMPITTSERRRNQPGYYPILIIGGNSNGVKGFVALWQLQNFDFKSRNGKIVNKITSKQYDDLLPYVKDMLDIN